MGIFKKTNAPEADRFVLKYYFAGVLEGAFFINAFLTIILNNSLTPVQVAVVLAMHSIFQCIFEIPTGALADRFGRKNVLLVGTVIFATVFSLFLFFRTFYWCMFIFALWGICFALFSGAFESLFYDNMKHYKIEKRYTEFKGRKDLFYVLAYSLTGFLGSLIVKNFGYDVLIATTILTPVLSLVNLMTIKDFYSKNENLKKLSNNYFKILKNAFKYSLKHTTVFKFLTFGSLWLSLLPVLVKYDGLYLSKITGRPEITGFLVGIESAIISIFQFLFIKKLAKTKTSKIFAIFFAGSVAVQISYIIFNFPVSYTLLVFHWICIFLIHSVLESRQQQYIPSKIRATIISLRGFVIAIFNFVYLMLFGTISQKFGYKIGYNVVAAIQLSICVIFFVVLGFDKHLRKKERKLS